ncbi:MAG TPA: SgcJ/EcaC family oxidoreductase, partial [Acetobacteraceae bacterium]|nr:SgcJ/EcaC family oxidoreductase [Acetobacteraceae bacterium]
MKAVLAALVFAALLAGPQAGNARSVACQKITNDQVAALFDRWNRTLATQNPDAVVANYATDATLLPTVQNGLLIGPAAIRGYFVHFLEKAPQGTIDQRVIHIGCNIAYDVGLYSFTVNGDQPGSRKQMKARYTFIYAPEHG